MGTIGNVQQLTLKVNKMINYEKHKHQMHRKVINLYFFLNGDQLIN